MHSRILVITLLFLLALGAFCVLQQSFVVAQREAVAGEIQQQNNALTASIARHEERLVRLESDMELNVLLARDKMRLVRPGERLLVLENVRATSTE